MQSEKDTNEGEAMSRLLDSIDGAWEDAQTGLAQARAVDVLDRIEGAWDRIERGRRQATNGETIALDEL